MNRCGMLEEKGAHEAGMWGSRNRVLQDEVGEIGKARLQRI